jgi:hypothetical protein
MLRHALSPTRIAAAFSLGALMAAGILAVSDYLTGAILGLPSDLPWARPYYGEMQHPAALYRAVGFLHLCVKSGGFTISSQLAPRPSQNNVAWSKGQ